MQRRVALCGLDDGIFFTDASPSLVREVIAWSEDQHLRSHTVLCTC